MAILEVIMIVIGLGAVFLSFRATDSGTDTEKSTGSGSQDGLKNITEEADRALDKFISEIQSKADETLDSTDDKLGTILNEKIMGLSEYSQQILDKMEKNHSETVFLYDMLNEKEKEIKELVHNIDVIKADIRDELAKEYQEHKRRLEVAVQMPTEPVIPSAPVNDGLPDELLYSSGNNPGSIEEINNMPVDRGTVTSPGTDEEPGGDVTHAAMYDAEIARIEEQERREKSLRKLYGNMGISDIEAAEIEAGIGHVDHSDEIISLHKKGRTVLEISKMLDVGQGEVKFVIDMYEAS